MKALAIDGGSGFGAVASVAPWPPSPLHERADRIEKNIPLCAACASFDNACLCEEEVKRTVDKCILRACAIPEAIFTRNLTETTCQTPVRNRTIKFNGMIISMTACAVVFVVLRLIHKQFFSARRRLNAEDWTLIAAIALGIPSVALTIFGLTAHGLGADLWGLERSNLIVFGRYFYVIQIIYILLMALVKLTLTLFYLNIFFGRGIRALLWATVVFHIANAVAFTIAIIFQCLPIIYQWEKYNYVNNNSVEGHYFNINAAGWANSAITVASDIWLLAIPLSQVHKLRLHWKKKLGAALMFLAGASATVISFLRLASVRDYASTSNPTWDQWDIVWWSTIEVEVGLICTCLPAIRLILVRLAPRIFGSEFSSSSIALNYNSSKGIEHTRLDEDEETCLPKRSSAPAATSLETVPKHSEPVLYDCCNTSHTSISITAVDSKDGWHDEVPLRAAKKPNTWRSSMP